MGTTDFLVIGGGMLGLNVARRLKREYGDSTVTVIEKEAGCGLHASGRNSGVLHAGFYYPADSLKARYTARGNRLLTEYCVQKRLPINRCGKLVVAKTRDDHPGLDELHRRGRANGVELEEVSAADARRIEPRVKTHERALYCPATATVDPAAVMQAVTADALNEGVKLDCGVRYLGRRSRGVQTSAGSYHPGYVVNAAGLYADRIARDFGFSERYRILPFKGLYVSSADPGETVRTNIYPVPDLRMPFLGVHVTRTPAGITKIGPTAVPALWREQYAAFANFRLSEFVDVTLRQLYMVAFGGPIFRRLAVEELRKYSRRSLVALASSLMNGVRPERYRTWCTAGIRAQLVDTRRGTLEMDFVLEADDHSMHVLNAVSPGFTCALPFAEDVCRAIGAALGRRAGTGSAGIALAEAAR